MPMTKAEAAVVESLETHPRLVALLEVAGLYAHRATKQGDPLLSEKLDAAWEELLSPAGLTR